MDIYIFNPDNVPLWLVFEILETISYKYPDFCKIEGYKADFEKAGEIYELEIANKSNAIITKKQTER